MTIEELNRMRKQNIMDLKREELAHMEDIVIDTEKCVESRIESFLEQAPNPFAMNAGEYILKLGFMEEAKDSFDERMLLLAKRKTRLFYR